MDRLHESLAKDAHSILKIKMASDKGKIDGLNVEINGARTASEKILELNFAIHYH